MSSAASAFMPAKREQKNRPGKKTHLQVRHIQDSLEHLQNLTIQRLQFPASKLTITLHNLSNRSLSETTRVKMYDYLEGLHSVGQSKHSSSTEEPFQKVCFKSIMFLSHLDNEMTLW